MNELKLKIKFENDCEYNNNENQIIKIKKIVHPI